MRFWCPCFQLFPSFDQTVSPVCQVDVAYLTANNKGKRNYAPFAIKENP
jgi:hypothetical protein